MADADEILRRAGQLFSRVGTSVKRATQKVTGVGLGSLALELDATRVAPGDEVRGRVVLTLPEPIDARRLRVGLRAHQRTVGYQRSEAGRTVETTRAELYRFDQDLGPARRYASETRAFALLIPPDAALRRAPAPAGALGDVARAVSSVVSPTTGPIEWQVVAVLEIPWSRDLSSSADIIVG